MKYKIEEVRNYFKKYGYELLSSEYKNTKTKLKVLCPKGHEWKVSFFDFKVRKVRCPKCYGNYYDKEEKEKEIIDYFSQFNYKVIRIENTKNIYVLCPSGHEWKISFKRFKKGSRCPYCNGRKKTFLIIKEFIEKEGYKLLSNSYSYHKKLKIECPNGHIFEMKWNDFQQGHRCPKCIRKYDLTYNEIKELIGKENFKLLSSEEEIKNTYFVIKCLKCGYEFETNLYKWFKGHRCFKCWSKDKISKIEKELYEILKENDIEFIIHDRNIISPYEIDIYIPKFRLGLEICGLFWHSFQMKQDKYYHQKKWKKANEKNITLFQIFEDEWYNHKDVIVSKILLKCNKLNQFKKFRAEELNVVELNDKSLVNEFLENYHLQGGVKSCLFSLGLSLKNNIEKIEDVLGLIVISKHRFSKNSNDLEIVRLCFKPFILIYGGSEKLIKKSIEKIQNNFSNYHNLISFIDLRYFSGKLYYNIYTKLGFELEKITSPNYFYFNKNDTSKKIHRFTLRKRKNESKNLSEFQLREKEGWYWIYDAGHLKYSLELK